MRERRRGQGQEFSDHRDYAPGDEIRHIDWNAYARLDRAKVRVFEETERPPLTILIDRSSSMEGDVFRQARQIAAGLAYVGLAHLGEVIVIPFASEREAGLGPLRGRGSFRGVLDFLKPMRTGGATRLDPILRWAAGGRRGVWIVLSDLLENGNWTASIRRARGHTLVLLHCKAEAPDIQGAVLLRDRETGEVLRRTITTGDREKYRQEWEASSVRIKEASRRNGGIYLRARSGAPFDETVLEVLEEIA
ncbi:MAG: DUF58 domain-containing protein [Planctomycetota bacterium]|nr:DUF58 domain-containing protein [Planctomycetota bacterium]